MSTTQASDSISLIENEDEAMFVCMSVGNRIAVTRSYARYPLKLVLPAPINNTVTDRPVQMLYVTSYGGGMVAGDRLQLRLEIGDECAVVACTHSYTKAYRSAIGHECQSIVHASIGIDALLAWLPDPLCCFNESRFYQQQTFRLHARGNIVMLDWMLGGRIANGERWSFTSFESINRVLLDDEPLIVEQTELVNHIDDCSLSVAKRMSSFDVMATVVVVGTQLQFVSEHIMSRVAEIRINSLHGYLDTEGYDAICSASVLPPVSLLASSRHQSHARPSCGVVLRVAGQNMMGVRRLICEDLLSGLESVIGCDPWRRSR